MLALIPNVIELANTSKAMKIVKSNLITIWTLTGCNFSIFFFLLCVFSDFSEVFSDFTEVFQFFNESIFLFFDNSKILFQARGKETRQKPKQEAVLGT